jgi:hypothetical protein
MTISNQNQSQGITITLSIGEVLIGIKAIAIATLIVSNLFKTAKK